MIHTMRSMRAVFTIVSGLAVTLAALEALAKDVVVYSSRKEELIRPAIQTAERALGVKVTLFTAGAGELARRIELERTNPKGDVFIGTTAGFAELMRQKGLLDTFTSPLLNEIPPEFRSPDNSWVPVTARVRVLMVNTNLIKPLDAPKSYFDLTASRWKGQVAVASMGERTTVGWLAAIMAARGEGFAKKYVADLKANGLKVLKNNTEVRKAVSGAEYAIGITNHYYYLLQLQDEAKSPVGIVYPDQGLTDMGTPVFSITAAVIKGARNADTARSLLEFFLTPDGNRLLVEGEFEIPLLPGLHLPGAEKGIQALGQFRRPALTQVQLAELEPKVERLFGGAMMP